VVGIVSHGASHDHGCSHGGIDTRVDAYLDWIAQQMAEPGPPDAGPPPAPDAAPAPPDAGPAPHPDAGAPADGDGGGCSCQVGQARTRPGTMGLLGGLALVFALRTAGRRARRRGSRTPA